MIDDGVGGTTGQTTGPNGRLTRPRRLEAGARLVAVSLSWGGPGTFPHRFEAGKRQFEAEFEVELVPSRHALSDASWLQRNPEARADDLMAAFADPNVSGIVASIGGDDAIRLAPFVDLEVIRANPKVLLGYSDTTNVHFLCRQAGLATFYGPSVMSGLAENLGIPSYLVDSLRRTLFVAEPLGEVAPNNGGWTAEHLDWGDPTNQSVKRRLEPSTGWRWLTGRGTAQGRLIGGCVESLQYLRGTPLWPSPESFDGAILFLETSEEAPPPAILTRELRTLAAMGLLQRLHGVLLGRPGGGVDPARFGDYDHAVLEVVRDEVGLDDLIVVTQMDFGHTDPMMVLPYGMLAELDFARRRFSFLEAAVV